MVATVYTVSEKREMGNSNEMNVFLCPPVEKGI